MTAEHIGRSNLRERVQATREPGRLITRRRRTRFQKFIRLIGLVVIFTASVYVPDILIYLLTGN